MGQVSQAHLPPQLRPPLCCGVSQWPQGSAAWDRQRRDGPAWGSRTCIGPVGIRAGLHGEVSQGATPVPAGIDAAPDNTPADTFRRRHPGLRPANDDRWPAAAAA